MSHTKTYTTKERLAILEKQVRELQMVSITTHRILKDNGFLDGNTKIRTEQKE